MATLGAAAQTSMAARGVPGVEADPRFWASGIIVGGAYAEPARAPAVHMNTRMFWTPARLVVWRRFGSEPLH